MSKLLNTLPEKGYDKRELSREEVGPNPDQATTCPQCEAFFAAAG